MSSRTAALASLSMLLAFAPVAAKPKPPAKAATAQTGPVLDHYLVRPNVHMFSAPSGNILVFTGDDGVLVVDPGTAETSGELLRAIAALSPDVPIRWVVDTSANADHVGANASVAAAGDTLEGGNTRPVDAVGKGSGGAIWAHEAVLNRMTAENRPGIPSNTYFVASKDMWINGEAVQILNASPGAEEGDSFVYIRGQEVIAAGDIYSPDRYPQIDLDHGGSIQGVIDGLNALLRISVPEFNEEGGTIVVPGHGRISDEADVALYRDMVTIIRDRIADMIARKLTLTQVLQERPTFDYDPVYGTDAGKRFTETVYRSLTQTPPSERSPS